MANRGQLHELLWIEALRFPPYLCPHCSPVGCRGWRSPQPNSCA